MKPPVHLLQGSLATLLCLCLLTSQAKAQAPAPNLPQESPKATISQLIGITHVTVTYNRPSVKGRKVWGDLVPYNDVWRAGANENTVVEFSTPVSIGGKELSAGKYGLHMIPTESAWTVIFNKNSSNWGSFSYDEKDDALRTPVTPQSGPAQEQLAYAFESVTKNSGVLVLAWEKLRIPIKIDANTHDLVVHDLRQNYLHGVAQFGWQGWSQAANYCAMNNTHLEEGLAWADKSIAINENFNNLSTKSRILQNQGKAQESEALMQKALSLANEAQLNNYGYQLLGAGKITEAIEIFARNVKKYPESWNVYDSLAEALEKSGDKKTALKNYQKALSLVKDEQQRKRINGVIKKLT